MAAIANKDELVLFGGHSDWSSDDWTASDDRVRGGKSQSYLDTSDSKIGRFHGTLDIKTLGGAGFASQRTTGDDRCWDLSDYVGVRLSIAKGDKKRYTFILKDELPAKRSDGRDESTISYEIDFNLPPESEPGDSHAKTIYVPFKSFNATYRGKLQKDAPALDLKTIRRMSIMMRSHFGAQEGDFSLSIRSIAAISKIPDHDEEKRLSVFVDGPQLETGLPPGTNSDDHYVFRMNNSFLRSNATVAVHKHAAHWTLWAFTFVGGLYLGWRIGDRSNARC